jgi:hypothetical protein
MRVKINMNHVFGVHPPASRNTAKDSPPRYRRHLHVFAHTDAICRVINLYSL